MLKSNRRHFHTKRYLSETSRQVHLPRKQCLINEDRHRHVTSKGMDCYRSDLGHMELRPPITKTITVRRTRYAGNCWRSRDELISDVLLWTLSYGRAKAGRPPRTYMQQLCEDTGYCPDDLLEAMNDREGWREGSGISVVMA